jgi:hypothetical protein
MSLVRKSLGYSATVLAGATLLYIALAVANGTLAAVKQSTAKPPRGVTADAQNARNTRTLFQQGRRTFRFDTFGDQAFWGNALQLHRAIAGARNGGVGGGVSPKTALAVGLKVDSKAIPRSVAAAIKAGKVNLDDPKVTLTLLRLNAVVGLKGFFSRTGRLSSVGITCALCHSTVDDSFSPGIGRRLDGWPNQDLDVGKIISLAPNKKPLTDLLGVNEATVNRVLTSWGPGEFDASLSLDGQGFRPDGKPASTRIPPAFGLAGVNLATYTGWGTVTYWNAFVANLEMHGFGTFVDDRLANANQFPVAAKAGFADVRNRRDLISSKLPALHFYQLSIPAPKPPRGSFDSAAARRGKMTFNAPGKCANCHVPPTFSEPGWNLHAPREMCTDAFQASRSPTFRYRTTPLRGIFAKSKRGFWHDGRFRTLEAVVEHYNDCFRLGLNPNQKRDLVQYVKSL